MAGQRCVAALEAAGWVRVGEAPGLVALWVMKRVR
jgi:hypothetical protein